MNDAERIEINNIAVSIMEDSLYPKELFEVAKRIYDLTKDPRPDWTPCAEGTNLPKDGVYDVTLKNENGTRGVVTGYLVDGAWANTGLYTSTNIVAYMPKPYPYRADQKEDAE